MQTGKTNNVIDMFTRKPLTIGEMEQRVPEQKVNPYKGAKREFLILDCETGGVDPFKNSLLTIGLVAMKYDPEIDSLVYEDSIEIILKSDYYNVTEKAMEINQLDLEYLQAEGNTPEEAVQIIQAFIMDNFEEKPIVVGHNVGMDKYFLSKLLQEYGYSWDYFFSHRLIDVMGILWGMHFSGQIPLSACNSEGSLKHFWVENLDPHNAESDAMAIGELFEELIQQLGGWKDYGADMDWLMID